MRWPRCCTPIVAVGHFNAGVTVTYWLHSVGCTASIHTRHTITQRRRAW
jgi:hypothetical protein